MKNWKRTVSALLCMAMLMGNIPAVSFASETDSLYEHRTEHLKCGYVCDIYEQTVEETTEFEATTELKETSEPKVAAETTGTEATQGTAEPDTQIRLDTVETGTTVQSAPDVDMPENEELLACFAKRELYGYEISAYGVAARGNLTDIEQAIYDVLKAEIEVVAISGGSTVFVVSGINGLKTTWTNAELGVPSIDDGALVDTAFLDQFNIDNIVAALLNDCPFDLYWYDKTVGVTMYYQIDVSGHDDGINAVWDTATVENLSFVFAVSADYKSGDYAVTSDVEKITAAKNNAALVVANNADKSDYEKLVAYKNYICAAVSYDQSAADDTTTPYGNPWQMISVFDGDSETNVVCEGYAKAFQYLCDLTTFAGDTACCTVSGQMDGSNHMWNIVTLEESNYLVDVTNSDSGSVGQNGSLFLAGASGSAASGYSVDGNSYIYDSMTLNQWGTDANSILTLAAESYMSNEGNADLVASGTTACGQVWMLTHEGVLTISGTGSVESGWEEYRDEIRKIVVGEGITELRCFFYGYTALTEVELPGTLESIGFAFSECLTLETVRLSEGTKIIGPFAFDGCIKLNSINFPSTLELIDEEAFRNTGLESVTTSCPEIGYFAFTGCRSLREVILEEGVRSVGAGAFAYNAALETVVLPTTITSIGNDAFCECTNLSSSITIPEGVTVLEESIFFRCEKLEEVHLPGTIRSIGSSAFQYSGITSLTVPDSVESINDAAFYGCRKLQSLDLGNGVKYIGDAFFNCSIPSLHVPASVETIDTTSWNFSMMAKITVDTDNPYFRAVDGVLYNKDMTEIIFCPPQWTGELVIPDTVQTLADGAFSGCGSITSVTIPDSVTTFGTNIFAGCSVHTVVLPDGMEAIPDGTFNECLSLVSVELPDSIKSIGTAAFRSCVFLEELHIPAGVSCIGGEAFAGCHMLQLSVAADSPYYRMLDGVLYSKDMRELVFATCYAPKNFTVPEGVEILRDCSFGVHEDLKRIVLADSVKHIGEYAFASLYELTDVVFGTGLKSIGNSAFYNCQKLEKVVFADATFSIGSTAFEDCVSLTSMVIPGTVTKIDNLAFEGCAALANIQIESITERVGGSILSGTAYHNNPDSWINGCLYLSNWLITGEPLASDTFKVPDGTYGIADSALSGQSTLAEVTVPGSVKIIGNSAFSGCSALERVNLSHGLERIEDLAFVNCRKLGALAIPATVTYIGWQFWVGLWDWDCNTLVFLGDAPEFHEQAFMNIMPTIVYYPETLDSWSAIAGSYFGATHSSISWLSYGAEQCPRHDWIMSRCLHDCGEGGDVEYTCLICQETYTETVAPSEHSLSETITAATCTEDGYITRDCTICEYICVEYLADALGHSYGEWFTTMEPGCTWDGERWRACSYCGHTEIEILPAHGHNYESYVTNPTCAESGCTTHTCSVCGDNYQDSYVDALGHSYGDWTQTEVPTCEEAGEESRECANCGSTEKRVMDAIGHNYEAVVTAPTCTAQGWTTHTCSNCGGSYVDSYTDAMGHSYGDWTQTEVPTCEEAGEESRECANCGSTEKRVMDAIGHNYEAVVTAPTCTAQGWTTHTCSNCGDSYVDSYTDALDHDYSGWAVTKEATYEADGEERRECSRCGDTQTRIIPMLTHRYESVVTAPTCTEKGYTTHTCADCGDSYVDSYTDAMGHSYGDWTQTEVPTCEEAGEESRECANCGSTEKRVIDAIGHNYEAVVTTPTCTAQGWTTHTCSNCGDSYVDSYVDALGHSFEDGTCVNCGSPEIQYLRGEIDLDGDVDVDDVLALLWNVLFPDMYPIEAEADFDGNGAVDVDDVLALLWHVLFPDMYPI